MSRLFALVIAVLLSAAPLSAQTNGRLVWTVDSLAEAALREGPTAGLSIAVVRGPDTIVQRGYGLADIENGVEASALTVYRVGSITKQFTASAIMKLVEEGKIDLGAPVTRYLPDYPTQDQAVTVEHLLTHTSGIKSYTGLGETFERVMREDLTHDQLIALFKDEPFDFAPGERYAYNNSGYYLLGVIIERVTGRTYADYLRDEFFEPLGMQNSHYCTNREIIPHRAEGYARDSSSLVNDEYISMRLPYAAGSLCANVGDLVRWTDALNDGQVVSKASYERMTTPMTLNDGSMTSYGYGLGIGTLGDHRVIQHGGGINGFNTHLAYFPDDDLTIVVLANTEGANPGAIGNAIARLVLGVESPRALDLPLNEEDAGRYTGVYELGTVNARVFTRDGALMIEVNGQPAARILYQGAHRFVVADDVNIELLFDVPDEESAVGVIVRQAGQDVAQGPRRPE